MCGVRSAPHLCGIPGITQQAPVVVKGGKDVWGWCMHCVRATFPYVEVVDALVNCTTSGIIDLYELAARTIVRQYHSSLMNDARRAKAQGHPNSFMAYMRDAERIEADYGLTDTPVS
jgi:hypothetical protein